MKKIVTAFSAIAALIITATPVANALTSSQVKECKAMGADLQARQVKAKKLADERLVLLDELEVSGDTWENAETMRNFGASEAAEADRSKAEYNILKSNLLTKEFALQDLVGSLNGEVSSYNRKCVKK